MGRKMVIGCGYLGERVARLWREQGHTVLATTRTEERGEQLRAMGLEPILCDVTEPDSLVELPKVESVVHCIGLDRSAGKSMREVYVEGLRAVLKRLPEPRRFLYVSSTSVYGQTDGSEVSEASEAAPMESSGQTVLEAEHVLREHLPSAIVLRFAGIYGPGRMLRADRIRAGEKLGGDPEKWLNLIHVEDGARAVLAAEAHGIDGEIYNVSDGRPVTRRDFFNEVAELLGAPKPEHDESKPTGRDTNRRIGNRRLTDELGFTPGYPSYREGLRASR